MHVLVLAGDLVKNVAYDAGIQTLSLFTETARHFTQIHIYLLFITAGRLCTFHVAIVIPGHMSALRSARTQPNLPDMALP